MTAIDVRLLRDVHQICRIPLDRGGGVRACDLCDPYAVILLVDGTLAVVEVVEKGEGAMEEGGGEEEATLQLTWPDIKEVGKEVRENNLHTYLLDAMCCKQHKMSPCITQVAQFSVHFPTCCCKLL